MAEQWVTLNNLEGIPTEQRKWNLFLLPYSDVKCRFIMSYQQCHTNVIILHLQTAATLGLSAEIRQRHL